MKGVLAQIARGTELNQHYISPKDSVRKTWNNWMRLAAARNVYRQQPRNSITANRKIMTARIRYRESNLCKSRASVTGAWQVKFSQT